MVDSTNGSAPEPTCVYDGQTLTNDQYVAIVQHVDIVLQAQAANQAAWEKYASDVQDISDEANEDHQNNLPFDAARAGNAIASDSAEMQETGNKLIDAAQQATGPTP